MANTFPMWRVAKILLATFATGCTCKPEPTPSAPVTTAATTTTATTTATRVASETREQQPSLLNADQQRAISEHIRRARQAARERHFAEAEAAFAEALAIDPDSPGVLCEAGFLAHQASHDAVAVQRIDRALAMYADRWSVGSAPSPSSVAGPREAAERLTAATVDASSRSAVAMCLFNRGLLAESTDDALARTLFQSSLVLRPNAAVARHVEALPPEAPVLGSRPRQVAGVSVDYETDDTNFTLVRTSDAAQMRDVVRQLITCPIPEDAATVADSEPACLAPGCVFVVRCPVDPDADLAYTIVLAQPERRGFLVTELVSAEVGCSTMQRYVDACAEVSLDNVRVRARENVRGIVRLDFDLAVAAQGQSFSCDAPDGFQASESEQENLEAYGDLGCRCESSATLVDSFVVLCRDMYCHVALTSESLKERLDSNSCNDGRGGTLPNLLLYDASVRVSRNRRIEIVATNHQEHYPGTDRGGVVGSTMGPLATGSVESDAWDTFGESCLGVGQL